MCCGLKLRRQEQYIFWVVFHPPFNSRNPESFPEAEVVILSESTNWPKYRTHTEAAGLEACAILNHLHERRSVQVPLCLHLACTVHFQFP